MSSAPFFVAPPLTILQNMCILEMKIIFSLEEAYHAPAQL